MPESMHRQEALFFIAIVPNAEISAEVTAFKEYAAHQFQSSRALNSPPHITLFPPFRWARSKEKDLKVELRAFSSRESPFPLLLEGFDCFRPRVIFIDIATNEALQALQGRLQDHLARALNLEQSDDRPFHPHMTVAFKDLRRSVFPDAWKYFSAIDYARYFTVDQLVLLRHYDRKWNIDGRFPFG